jgi:hypothetical protein
MATWRKNQEEGVTGRYSVAHCIQLHHSMDLSFLLNAGREYYDVDTNPS